MNKSTSLASSEIDCNNVQSLKLISNYLNALKERTRHEKQGVVHGFDWVMFNLGQAMGWQPVRLPFKREPGLEVPQSKTEPEFGIDLSFLSKDRSTLYILVLKAEPLTNKRWTSCNFDSDLRMAICPDLSTPELSQVKSVCVILSYNRDEERTGVQLFDNFVNSNDTKIKGEIPLIFKRWNLSKLSELVQQHLMTPELLPQNLSGVLSYICSQVSDFRYGSSEWDLQLVPNWRRFLTELDKVRDKQVALRLVPVALTIIKQHKCETPDAVIGWLDLMEWAMLWLWNKYDQLDEKYRMIIRYIWIEFFLINYKDFLLANAPVLAQEHGIQTHQFGSGLDPINDSCTSFWLVERIGVFVMACREFVDDDLEEDQEGHRLLSIATP